MWGYNMQVTDEALERIGQAIRDRDVTIAFLQQRIADLTAQAAAVPSPPRCPSRAEPPRGRLPQHTRPADAGVPPGPEDPAEPADPLLAPEERPR